MPGETVASGEEGVEGLGELAVTLIEEELP